MAAQLYEARRGGFGYGARDLVHGEVLELAAEGNEVRLIGLGFFVPFAGEPVRCAAARCGRRFASADALAVHRTRSHGVACGDCARIFRDAPAPMFPNSEALARHNAAAHFQDVEDGPEAA